MHVTMELLIIFLEYKNESASDQTHETETKEGLKKDLQKKLGIIPLTKETLTSESLCQNLATRHFICAQMK